MSTVSTAFEKAAAEDRAALVGYLPAGFPDKQTAIKAAVAMVEAGADVIEVGLPYSDPLMDGPVIADAVYRALKGGAKIKDVFDTVQAVADAGAAALVMTYWNPVDKYGPDAFSRDLASAGGAGLITPDLTPEEAGPWLEASDAHQPGPRLPGGAVLAAAARRGDHQALPRLRLRGQPDGHHRRQGRGQLERRRRGRPHPRAHQPPGRGRRRRLHRRSGQAGRRSSPTA